MLARIGLESLEVDAQGGALGAGARQAQHDARAVLQHDAAKHDVPTQEALAGLIEAADQLAGIGARLGRNQPTVIT